MNGAHPYNPGCQCVACTLKRVSADLSPAMAAAALPALRHAAKVSSELETIHARLEVALGEAEGRRVYMLALSESKKSTGSTVEFVRDFAQRYIDAAMRGEPIK